MPAITAICGDSDCDAVKLLTAIGRSVDDGGQAPFGINFTLAPATPPSDAMNAPIHACNKALPPIGPNPGQEACTCSDCQDACFQPDFPTPYEPIYVLGVPLSWLIIGCLLAFIILAFLAYNIYACVKMRRSADEAGDTELLISTPGDDQGMATWQTRLGAAVDRGLSRAFSRLGYVIAQHPIATLLFSLTIVAVLCGGLTMFTVTTNPVELWSDPNSRARREKDYFDQHFGLVQFYSFPIAFPRS